MQKEENQVPSPAQNDLEKSGSKNDSSTQLNPSSRALSKMIFCALLQTALKVRDEFFEQDWQDHGYINADRIAKDAVKHVSDKQWGARQAAKLHKQMMDMRADKVKFDGRINVMINSILATVPKEQRKKYPFAIEEIENLIKNREI